MENMQNNWKLSALYHYIFSSTPKVFIDVVEFPSEVKNTMFSYDLVKCILNLNKESMKADRIYI